jgi:hypothetical protein
VARWRRSPRRFGFFAALPLPDVKASLTELDMLQKAQMRRHGLLINHGDRYLGDASPVLRKSTAAG